MPPKVCCARATGAKTSATQMNEARKKIESRALSNIRSSDQCGRTLGRRCRPKVRTENFCFLIRDDSPIRYSTPKMDARYAFFVPERSIFNLWQVSIISMAVFHREHFDPADFRAAAVEMCEIHARAQPAMRYHPTS